VAAHAWKIDHRRVGKRLHAIDARSVSFGAVETGDSFFHKVRLFPDAAEHEKLWRIESAAAKDHLTALLFGEVTDALAGVVLLHWARFVKVVAQRALHADGARWIGALLFLEEQARHVGAVLDDEFVRMLPPRSEEKLAHAEAAAASRLVFVVRPLLAL